MAFRASEYSHFHGSRSRAPVWWPVLTSTLRRGWSSKWVRRLAVGALGVAIAATLFLYVAYQVLPEWRDLLARFGKSLGDRGPKDLEIGPTAYLGLLRLYIDPLLLPLALIFGYDLIAADLRAKALELYFSRPLTPAAYLFGRTLAFAGFLLAVTLLPLLWIWSFDVLTAPAGQFERVRGVPLGLCLATIGISLCMALLVQAVTAVTRSGLWTNLVFVFLLLFSGIAGRILQAMAEDPRLLAVSLLEDIHVFAAWCLNCSEQLPDPHAPVGLAIGVLAALAALSLSILWRTLRRRRLVG